MRSKRRNLLILSLAVSHLACLLCAVVWATGWMRSSFEQVVRVRTEALGRSLAIEIAKRIDELNITSIEPGSLDWKSAQQICQEAEVPDNGFLTIVRADTGALLCHPDLTHNPALLQSFPGRSVIDTGDDACSLIETLTGNGNATDQFIAGRMIYDDALYNVAAYSLPRLNAILLVNQSDASTDAVIAQLVQPVSQAGLVLTTFLVGVTTIFAVFLTNRCDEAVTQAEQTVVEEVELQTKSLVRSRNAVVFGLAKLADSRDSLTSLHLDRIRSYVTILASQLAKSHPEITPQYVADLAVASSLHDIGKIGVPESVLLKPSRLSSSERRAMELHTLLGNECLESIQRQLGNDEFLQLAQQIAMSHHEHWDGSGYPRGVQGKEIPLAARIVSLADVYDALTTARPYRSAISHEEAREWIASHYGTQFDPEVVEAFVARSDDFEKIRSDYVLDDVTRSGTSTRSGEPAKIAAGVEVDAATPIEAVPSSST